MADAQWWIYYCSKSKNYTTLLWFSSNAESVPAQRVPVKIDCLDLSNSMKSACPDCTSMKVQIVFMATYDPRIEAPRRWLNFQVVAWAGVLTSRNSLKLCGKAKGCLQTYPIVLYAGHSMSFIPGFFTTKSWLVVACCCSSQFSQWKSFSEAESCKSLSPSREVIRYGADPLCSRCTPMITHVFIAGFRTNIDTVSEQCASNGDLPHSADTCIFIFFCEEYQQYVNQDSADRSQTKKPR